MKKHLCDISPEELHPGIKLISANGVSGTLVSYENNLVTINWENGKQSLIPLDPKTRDLDVWKCILNKVEVKRA